MEMAERLSRLTLPPDPENEPEHPWCVLRNSPGITSRFRFVSEYDAFETDNRICEDDMGVYPVEVERMMKRLFGSLKESDRRRYAAIETAKLGHGGVESIAAILGCDPKTIRQGRHDLDQLPDGLEGRVRKKGAGRSRA